MGKGLRIVHLNVRSLAKHYDELSVLFRDYDMILLSETWLNSSFDVKLLKMKGFVLYHQNRDLKIEKRGGGLAIYMRSDIALYATTLVEFCDVTCNLEQL